MNISVYLLLLIILLVFNLLFWLLIISFRILFNCELGICCPDTESVADEVPEDGFGNPGFTDDDPVTAPQRPFSINETMETPPSYEEALKYDQFGFEAYPGQSASLSAPSGPAGQSSLQNFSGPVAPSPRPAQQPARVIETVRPRSATASSTVLTPITEEEAEDSPVTVVIDSIGVQAARLLDQELPKVDLPEGEQLQAHSNC